MDFSRIGWNYAKDGSRISQSEFANLRDNHFETYARIGLTDVPGAGERKHGMVGIRLRV